MDGIRARRQGKISKERVEVRVRLQPEFAERLQRDADAVGCPLSTMAAIAIARAYGAVTDLMGPHLDDRRVMPVLDPGARPLPGGGIEGTITDPPFAADLVRSGAHFHCDWTGVWQLRDTVTGEAIVPRLVTESDVEPADLIELWDGRGGWAKGRTDTWRKPSLEHRQGDDLIVLALHDEGLELQQSTDTGWRHTLLGVPDAIRVLASPRHREVEHPHTAPGEKIPEPETAAIVDHGGNEVKSWDEPPGELPEVSIDDGQVRVKYFTDPTPPTRPADDGHRHRYDQPLNGDGAEYRKGELFAFHRCRHCTMTTPEPKKVRA